MKTFTNCTIACRMVAAIIMVLVLQNVHAQSFTITPSSTVSGSVPQFGYLALEIDLNNVSSTPLRMEYELVSNSMPPSWSAVMCDYTSCFPYINSNRVMEPAPVGDHAFIKITVNPDSVLGSGTVVYDVWENGVPSSKQTITFNINAVVGVKDALSGPKLEIYPNPVTDRLMVRMSEGSLEGVLRIYSLTGILVTEMPLTTSALAEINIGDIAPGAYIILCETTEGTFTRKLIKSE